MRKSPLLRGGPNHVFIDLMRPGLPCPLAAGGRISPPPGAPAPAQGPSPHPHPNHRLRQRRCGRGGLRRCLRIRLRPLTAALLEWWTQGRRLLRSGFEALAGVSAMDSASSQRFTTSQRRTTSQKFLG